jgi:hypothetical protein
MQRFVKIATKSVHYFRRFEVTDKRTLTFLYIKIYVYSKGSKKQHLLLNLSSYSE